MFLSIILVIVAALPPLFLLIYVYSMDKIVPEPVPLIMWLIVLGAISAVIAFFLEGIGDGIIRFLASDQQPIIIVILTYLMVGAVEEGIKYIFLRVKTWKNPHFDYKFDGIVYAVAISMGFALFENVGFVINNGIVVAASRAVLAVPAHMSFSVVMGVLYSYSKFYRNRGREQTSRLCGLLAWLLPVGMHGLYDTLATLQTTASTVLYICLVGALYVVGFGLINRESKHDMHL